MSVLIAVTHQLFWSCCLRLKKKMALRYQRFLLFLLFFLSPLFCQGNNKTVVFYTSAEHKSLSRDLKKQTEAAFYITTFYMTFFKKKKEKKEFLRLINSHLLNKKFYTAQCMFVNV